MGEQFIFLKPVSVQRLKNGNYGQFVHYFGQNRSLQFIGLFGILICKILL